MQVSKVREFILAGVCEIDVRAPEKFRELIQPDHRKYGEVVIDKDFKEQLETMNEELEVLNAAARDLEVTIASNVAEILET